MNMGQRVNVEQWAINEALRQNARLKDTLAAAEHDLAQCREARDQLHTEAERLKAELTAALAELDRLRLARVTHHCAVCEAQAQGANNHTKTGEGEHD
jgi:chromosome segregation ATPase